MDIDLARYVPLYSAISGFHASAASLNSGEPDAALKQKGDMYRAVREFDAAIECYRRALEQNPHGAAIWASLGESYDELGQYQEALCCYDRALMINPNDRRTANGRSNLLLNLASPNR
ncbi:tetratricopeptide repeat protein [Methanoculleus sp. FWC-SCC1]|uniref:Tetratricopeptide repeat protein n=1 Tax=Methanoculleus frigidifontis TaxID=2584085 RepID=A0ABT8MCU9_9EURY|nr:tetratricopeptide repeat protein [Methanoculleus sp. FWC-SCC1]MDN7025774.1 tetratricopeptide repeat protein [Methanoculleus sp. FWC-SCC1]